MRNGDARRVFWIAVRKKTHLGYSLRYRIVDVQICTTNGNRYNTCLGGKALASQKNERVVTLCGCLASVT